MVYHSAGVDHVVCSSESLIRHRRHRPTTVVINSQHVRQGPRLPLLKVDGNNNRVELTISRTRKTGKPSLGPSQSRSFKAAKMDHETVRLDPAGHLDLEHQPSSFLPPSLLRHVELQR
jgi:hypothetical protein